MDGDAKEIIPYRTEHGLTENWITRVAPDPDGNLWLGTGQSGLMRLSRQGFVQYTEADGLRPGWDAAFFETRSGRLLLAESSDSPNLFQLEGRVFRKILNSTDYSTGHPTTAPYYRLAEDSSGHLWVGRGRSIYRFPPGVETDQLRGIRAVRFEHAENFWQRRLYHARNGEMWFLMSWHHGVDGTGRKLLVQDGQGGQPHSIPAIEASLARIATNRQGGIEVECIQQDTGGAIWLGILGDRIVPPGRTTVLRYADGMVREFSSRDGLPRGGVNGMYLDRRGRLWLATHAGLVRAEDTNSERPRFTTFTFRHGLSSDEVYCITEDSEGFLYVGTAKGVDRLDPTTGAFRNFTTSDGLPHGRVSSALRDRRGDLWFASGTAVSRFQPRQLRPLRAPAIYVGAPTQALTMRYDHSSYEAEFSSPSFGAAPIRFQYKLTGIDSDWRAPVMEGSVRYAGMAPGSYELQARAVNAEGTVSAQPVFVRFTVTPPFWRSWWFAMFAIALIAAAGYWLHRTRLERILAVERVRRRVAADLHDDIGSTLSQVSMLSELAKRELKGAHPAATDLIDRMANASREAVSAMGDIVWSIHPRNDRLPDLVQRMRRFGSDVLSARGIEFDLSAPDTELAIGPEARRDLLLIFKESIHNAARHSGARHVRAAVAADAREVRLTVDDDGVGLGCDAGRNGHGLKTMRARSEKLGGRCEVGAAPGGGTRVDVTVPARARAA